MAAATFTQTHTYIHAYIHTYTACMQCTHLRAMQTGVAAPKSPGSAAKGTPPPATARKSAATTQSASTLVSDSMTIGANSGKQKGAKAISTTEAFAATVCIKRP